MSANMASQEGTNFVSQSLLVYGASIFIAEYGLEELLRLAISR